MKLERLTSCALALFFSLSLSCKKGEAEGTDGVAPASTDSALASGGPPEASPPGSIEVTTYPDTVPQGGTVRLSQPLAVYQAADTKSKLLTRLGAGTLVDLKGSRGEFFLVNWPSGVGRLSPGWVEAKLRDVSTAVTAASTASAASSAAPSSSGQAGKPDAKLEKEDSKANEKKDSKKDGRKTITEATKAKGKK